MITRRGLLGMIAGVVVAPRELFKKKEPIHYVALREWKTREQIIGEMHNWKQAAIIKDIYSGKFNS